MGGIGSVLMAAGSAVGSAAESIGSMATGPAQSLAKGAFDAGNGVINAGKDTLANAWAKTNAITSGNAGDIAYEGAKALFSGSYGGAKQTPSAPTNDKPQVVPAQAQAPDAKNELDKLMSNIMG